MLTVNIVKFSKVRIRNSGHKRKKNKKEKRKRKMKHIWAIIQITDAIIDFNDF